jgi:hypothetical protein
VFVAAPLPLSMRKDQSQASVPLREEQPGRLNLRMVEPSASELVDAAVRDAGRSLTRLPGRAASSGLLEVKEFGPALGAAFSRVSGSVGAVALNRMIPMADWNCPTSQVDLVLLAPDGGVAVGAELKVWDISHQIFDLAKVCCMLRAGVRAGFLICVARRQTDFDRQASGELFPGEPGETRTHDFPRLIAKHSDAWRHHAGLGGLEPTAVPRTVATTGVSVDIAIAAYPGHVARVARVSVFDPSPVKLTAGWPA